METMPICSPSSWISRTGLILICSLTRTLFSLMCVCLRLRTRSTTPEPVAAGFGQNRPADTQSTKRPENFSGRDRTVTHPGSVSCDPHVGSRSPEGGAVGQRPTSLHVLPYRLRNMRLHPSTVNGLLGEREPRESPDRRSAST